MQRMLEFFYRVISTLALACLPFSLAGQDTAVVDAEALESNFLHFCDELFEHNKIVSSKEDTQKHIPKVLHFVHLHSEPLSEVQQKNIEHFLKNNPGFTARLWTVDPMQAPSLEGLEHRKIADLGGKRLSKAFAFVEEGVAREEVVRLMILLEEGGVCVDDEKAFTFFLEPLLSRYDLFCSLDSEAEGTCCGALALGACAQSPIIKKVLSEIFSERALSEDITSQTISSAFKEALQQSSQDRSSCPIVIPASIFLGQQETKTFNTDELSSHVFQEKDLSHSDIEKLMSTSLARLKVQSKQFLSHFFALVALSLICVVMLAVVVIKVKQRYFS